MNQSVLIVGAGQIGFAAAKAFVSEGANVCVLARSQPRWNVKGARFQRYVAGEDVAPRADVVVDTIAYDAPDVARYDPGVVGRLIAISSASVYCDAQGRTLDEAAQHGFPDFPDPITEENATVPAGPQTYSTRKIRMEDRAFAAFGNRATILRPCAIYGSYSRHPREWWFVKRMRDGRARIPLTHEGHSRFQTSSVALIGAFAVAAARRALGGVYNLADACAPNVLAIGQTLARYCGAEPDFHAMVGTPAGAVGRTPWSIPGPFVVDGSKAMAGGHLQPTMYERHAAETVQWLLSCDIDNWRTAFPQLAAYPWDLFDYAAEDAFFKAS